MLGTPMQQAAQGHRHHLPAGEPPALAHLLQNIMFPLEIMRENLADYRERVQELIASVQLDGFENHFPRELSGGMQQRASIVARPVLRSRRSSSWTSPSARWTPTPATRWTR